MLDIPLLIYFSCLYPAHLVIFKLSLCYLAQLSKIYPTMGWKVHCTKLSSRVPPPPPSSCPFHKQVDKPGMAQYHYSVAGVSWEFFYISGSLDLSFGHTYSVLMMSNVHTSALIQTWALPEFEICMDKVCADGPEF